jgi:hypothetical protein
LSSILEVAIPVPLNKTFDYVSVGEKWRFDDYSYLCKGLFKIKINDFIQ